LRDEKTLTKEEKQAKAEILAEIKTQTEKMNKFLTE
jgi:hypothetical protein